MLCLMLFACGSSTAADPPVATEEPDHHETDIAQAIGEAMEVTIGVLPCEAPDCGEKAPTGDETEEVAAEVKDTDEE